jgi:phosphoglycolate phosphatase-like HAD superfamily hydrolase
MNALIFDIDGTLVLSNYMDGLLYKQAIHEFSPSIKFKKDWSGYTYHRRRNTPGSLPG